MSLQIKVLRDVEGQIGPMAAISYCWENSDATWARLNSELPNPHLDPLNHQGEEAPFLLDYWASIIRSDAHYADRLKRHYHEMRGTTGDPEPAHIAETAEPLDRGAHSFARGSSAEDSLARPALQRFAVLATKSAAFSSRACLCGDRIPPRASSEVN